MSNKLVDVYYNACPVLNYWHKYTDYKCSHSIIASLCLSAEWSDHSEWLDSELEWSDSESEWLVSELQWLDSELE